MDGTKLYRFTLRFGEARDTDDADGKVTATSAVRPTDAEIQRRAATLPRRHHAGAADLFGGEGRRRAGLRHGARGPRARAGATPRPGGPVRADRAARPRYRGVRGRLGQGRLHAQPGPRPRRWPAARSGMSPPCAGCGSARSPRRRRSRWTNSRGADDTAPASPDLLLPVATALADIPALALTEAEAGGLRHGQAISLVTLMGRIPAFGRSRWRVGHAPWRGAA